MASHPAIRHCVKSATVKILLQCHITPGVNKQRQGIQSLSDHLIEICVAAPARDGEANKAVREVLSNALKCPKSDLEIVRGHKSRDKTLSLVVTGMGKGKEEDSILRIRKRLEASIRST